MIYLYAQRSSSRITSNTMAITSSSPYQLTVNFDFLFKSENILVNRVLHPLAESIARSSDPDYRISARVEVPRGEPPASLDGSMATAVVRAVTRSPLPVSEHRELIDLALREARRGVTTPSLGEAGSFVLHLGFEIRTTSYYSVIAPVDEPWALEEVEVREGEEEKKCCICLEELIGGASRMPCSHVFHGGCIREWLTMRPCCPLCRYELATTTSRLGRTDVRSSGG